MPALNRNKGLALLAILALALSVTVAAPIGSASGGATAETAKKKKCKKAKKGADSAKKKKKCKKKKKKQQQPAPLVRATLTWDTDRDFDLWVFDASGNRARAASNPIPNTSFSPNDTIDTGGLGPETFTDLVFKKPGRNFSYGVCFEDGGSLNTTFRLTYVTADGVSQTASDTIGSDGGFRVFQGGAPTPDNFCKAS